MDEETSLEASYFAHYLHQKYFEVNYADGMVPLDKWFGSFHDGTPEANEAMKARRLGRGVRKVREGKMTQEQYSIAFLAHREANLGKRSQSDSKDDYNCAPVNYFT